MLGSVLFCSVWNRIRIRILLALLLRLAWPGLASTASATLFPAMSALLVYFVLYFKSLPCCIIRSPPVDSVDDGTKCSAIHFNGCYQTDSVSLSHSLSLLGRHLRVNFRKLDFPLPASLDPSIYRRIVRYDSWVHSFIFMNQQNWLEHCSVCGRTRRTNVFFASIGASSHLHLQSASLNCSRQMAHHTLRLTRTMLLSHSVSATLGTAHIDWI